MKVLLSPSIAFLTKYVCKLFFLCLLFIPTVSSETFRVALYHKGNPPYSIITENGPSGIFVDIFKRLEQLTPHKFVYRELPVARALKEFDEGNIDIEPGVNEQWRQARKIVGLYSIPFEISTEVIVFKKENAINTINDLYDKHVGIVRGYSYPNFEKAFNENKIIKVENLSESILLKQLITNRLQYVFIGFRTILYYQQQPIYKQLAIGEIVSEVQAKMRIHPSKAHFLPELNAGLKLMLENGDIEKIYQKYQ
ncbi:substrate-binding periplasmic protein [Colwelliaceae bacterium 6471]